MKTAPKAVSRQEQVDPVTEWLVSANDEFFGNRSRPDATQLKQALVGGVVFLIGIGVILSQVL